jgi:predicted SAM-dependent methyltransferase
MPIDETSFDAVIAGEFIEHLPTALMPSFLHEAFRVLKIGGVLAITTPNPSDLKRRLRGGTVLGGSHVSQHHAKTLRLQFLMVGFAHVRLRGTGKVSTYLGTRFPLQIYGSYMLIGRKI